MSESLHRQLQAALGDGYRLERELGDCRVARRVPPRFWRTAIDRTPRRCRNGSPRAGSGAARQTEFSLFRSGVSASSPSRNVGHRCWRWPTSMRALEDLDTLNVSARLRIDAARAIAHARLGHRDAALVIDSATAAVGDRRWLQGAVPLNRARIAAHSATRRVRSSCSTTQFSTRFSSTPKASAQWGAIHICSLFDDTHRFARY